jgi:hypothetical protein
VDLSCIGKRWPQGSGHWAPKGGFRATFLYSLSPSRRPPNHASNAREIKKI